MGAGGCGISLYLLLNFAVNLNVLLKYSLKKKDSDLRNCDFQYDVNNVTVINSIAELILLV